jgi:hypothetical protein
VLERAKGIEPSYEAWEASVEKTGIPSETEHVCSRLNGANETAAFSHPSPRRSRRPGARVSAEPGLSGSH